MRTLISSIFVLTSLITLGQNPHLEDLWKLYQSQHYEKVIELAKPHLADEALKLDLNLLLGRTYTDKGDFRLAIPFLEYTVENDPEKSWRQAWALGYLGTSHFMLQNYDESETFIKKCSDLKSTKNVTDYAKRRILLFGFDEFYRNWKVVKSENFRFHFQNMSDREMREFVASQERTFQNINAFFESGLPKKIDFFVWQSREDAKEILDRDLGFADPGYCIVHCHYQQTKGHEMTHVISDYTTKIIHKTGLINEGTSVYFDQTSRDREQMIKDWLKANDKRITIRDIWKNWGDYPESLTYPLAGLFVKELINNFGRDKFLAFFSDQSYQNAKRVFGPKLDAVVQEFENKINI